MNTSLKFIIVIITSSFFYGCMTSSLLPQAQNVPLFTKEKELQVSTQITVRSAEVQLAYSAKPHLAFMLNGLGGSLQMVELGAGYYTKLNDKFIFETYAGFGEGSVNVDYSFSHFDPILAPSPTQERCDINIFGTKFFIQPNIGFKYFDDLQLSLSLKTSYWYFPNYYFHRELWSPYHYGDYQLIRIDSVNINGAQCFTIEPAITFKTGGERVKFMAQVGFLAFMNPSNNKIIPFSYVNTTPLSAYNYSGKRYDSYLFVRLGMTFNFGMGKSKD